MIQQAIFYALLGMASESEWVVHRELANDTTVMNERGTNFDIHVTSISASVQYPFSPGLVAPKGGTP